MSEENLETINNETEPHIIIGSDRTIKVPDELKRIAVQFDHNVETVTFDCPRYWDDLDMSGWVISINYVRPDGEKGISMVDNVTIDETDSSIMHFDWTILRHATMKMGNLKFLVNIKKLDDGGNVINNWNSLINDETRIAKGINGDEIFADEEVAVIRDLIESSNKWHQYANNGEDIISKAITDLDENINIPDGATFEQLAECISKISTGMKMATGGMSEFTIPEKIEGETPFKPRIVIIYNIGNGLSNFNMGVFISPNVIGEGAIPISDSANGIGGKLSRKANAFTITDTGFYMVNTGAVTNLKWFAFGY